MGFCCLLSLCVEELMVIGNVVIRSGCLMYFCLIILGIGVSIFCVLFSLGEMDLIVVL